MTALIEFKNVRKSFDGLPVIDNISDSIAAGEIVSLVGPSGCGKSTLLRLIAGAEAPDDGKIVRRFTPDKIGFIFQDVRLLPWRSALQNILFVLKDRISDPGERKSRATNALRRVGLADFADYPPAKLSGGMQKRVAIARALAVDPDLLLLDEPFSDLDMPLRLLLIEEVQNLLKGTGKTVVYVTHDIREAIIWSKRIYVLTSRPARVKDVILLQQGENVSHGQLTPELQAIERNVIKMLQEELRLSTSRNVPGKQDPSILKMSTGCTSSTGPRWFRWI